MTTERIRNHSLGPPPDHGKISGAALRGGGRMGPMVAVRRFVDGDATAVAAIVEGLPDYITGDVPEKAPRDAERHDAWVLTSADAGSHADANADAVTGFAVVAR